MFYTHSLQWFCSKNNSEIKIGQYIASFMNAKPIASNDQYCGLCHAKAFIFNVRYMLKIVLF
jgi:hypothetical protein